MAFVVNRIGKEEVKMAKYKCEAEVVVFRNGDEERLADPKKDRRYTFLLATAGQEIDLALAQKLGLVKAPVPAKDEKKGKEKE